MSVLETGILTLRQRSGWEAADSGILLWRHNLLYLLFFFALPFLVPALTVIFIPLKIPFWIAVPVLWWLKPFFDRFILHIIALRFFEPDASPSRLFKGLGHSLGRGLPGDLLWRRVSPWRSASMPLRILENLRSAAVRRRKEDLKKGCFNFCILLSILGIGIEGMLLICELIFFSIMAEYLDSPLIRYVTGIFPYGSIVFIFYCFNYLLLEGLYVCMGFGLYINSRVEVEGWDIQLQFQQFTKRRRSQGRGGAALILLLLLTFFIPQGAFAQEDPVPLRSLEEVLESRDFGGEEESWGIRLKQWKEPEEKKPFEFNTLSWAERVREWTARILRLVLAAAALVLAGFSVLWLCKTGRRARAGRGRFLGGIDGGADGVSADPRRLLEQSRIRYARGELREAWAACLAAAIAVCEIRWGIAFPRNATEYECLALVRAWGAAVPAAVSREGTAEYPAAANNSSRPGTSPPEGGVLGLDPPVNQAGEGSQAVVRAFADLVKNWIALVYGGLSPEEGAFELALDFCQSLLPRGGDA
ncbi:MAG: hypothetical protein LBO80_02355 [Treponema sp.]|jgi:hypothetical protein|nr:hypothetical protein [Treponema sp.]